MHGCICENNIFTKRDTLTRRIPEETGELSQNIVTGKTVNICTIEQETEM